MASRSPFVAALQPVYACFCICIFLCSVHVPTAVVAQDPVITILTPTNGSVFDVNTAIGCQYSDRFANQLYISVIDAVSGFAAVDFGAQEADGYFGFQIAPNQCIDGHALFVYICLDSSGCGSSGLFTVRGCTRHAGATLSKPLANDSINVGEEFPVEWADFFAGNVDLDVTGLHSSKSVLSVLNQPNSGYIFITFPSSTDVHQPYRVTICPTGQSDSSLCGSVEPFHVGDGVNILSPSNQSKFAVSDGVPLEYFTAYPSFTLALVDVSAGGHAAFSIANVPIDPSRQLQVRFPEEQCIDSHLYVLNMTVNSISGWSFANSSGEFFLEGCTGKENISWVNTPNGPIYPNQVMDVEWMDWYPGSVDILIVNGWLPTNQTVASAMNISDDFEGVGWLDDTLTAPASCSSQDSYTLFVCANGRPYTMDTCARVFIDMEGCSSSSSGIVSLPSSTPAETDSDRELPLAIG
jgi:hypothetical protein